MAKKILAAFTLGDYEQTAEFKRGKDKQKRKKRGAGYYAGVGAGAIAGGSALSAGGRYGYAELRDRQIFKKKENRTGAGGGGAGRQLQRDIADVKAIPGRVKRLPGDIRKALNERGLASRIKQGVTSKSSKAYQGAKSFAGTGKGKIALGLGAASALGGAGYGGYRAYKNRKNKR